MKNIVILGAGFGGLRVARVLAKKLTKAGLNDKYRLILVDRNHYHTFTPLLYEAATTSKEIADMVELRTITTFQIKQILSGLKVDFINAEVEKIDIITGKINLKSNKGQEVLAFDHLVIALGAEVNTFNIKGVTEHAFYLKTFWDAMRLRDKIIENVDDGKKNLKIIIGGGGSTGVELAAEIQGWICELKEEYPKVRECEAQVSIVEGAGSILSSLHQKIIKRVGERLAHLGVNTITNEFISEVDADKIYLKSERILPCDIFIWAGGIKAPAILNQAELQKSKNNALLVQNKMQCLSAAPDLKLGSAIYGLGDSVCFINPKNGKPIPCVARPAIIQGGIIAHNIFEDIMVREGLSVKAYHKTFVPREYPYIVPAGGKWAAAKIGPFIFSGILGWVLKGLVELNYFLSILPVWYAFKIWFKGFYIFIKNDRLG
ncbi:MAG: FAD-dependent oxidoreductase [Candidatus Liptonbacteria bacterium]|nr:FAD-dependent oxidoreductase [Candidatus Liptonbacteria bacterium]